MSAKPTFTTTRRLLGDASKIRIAVMKCPCKARCGNYVSNAFIVEKGADMPVRIACFTHYSGFMTVEGLN